MLAIGDRSVGRSVGGEKGLHRPKSRQTSSAAGDAIGIRRRVVEKNILGSAAGARGHRDAEAAGLRDRAALASCLYRGRRSPLASGTTGQESRKSKAAGARGLCRWHKKERMKVYFWRLKLVAREI